jgi:carotenoid 1,2-hydratase
MSGQVLSLVSAAEHPDAWHDVRAPGGYEWWYFDAEDTRQDVQIVGILLDGFVFHPGYLRRHFRYLRRPTRFAPAQARDFPCAYFVIYEKGKLVGQFMTQYPPGSLVASRSVPEVTLGPNTLGVRDGEYRLHLEGTPWKLTGRGPQTLHGTTLSVDWSIEPISRHAPIERTFLSRKMTGASHHWVLAGPHSRYTATVKLGERSWSLSGLAYHDHNYGTGPLGPGLKRWIWGRALFEGGCYTFHHAVPRDATLPTETHLLHVTPGGVTELHANDARADFDARALGLAHPRKLTLHPDLELSNARLVDVTPFYLRLMYRACTPRGEGTAFCEVAYPHRLRWPVLGRMIEMSIDQR